jgi:predicted O-methyltransferase YrrM
MTPELQAYIVDRVDEHAVLQRLRAETAPMPESNMQIGADQGAFMAVLARLIGARRCLEIGTFTGYSSTAVALALPADGQIVCCDISTEWTDIARRAWADAGVADRVDLRIGPAVETLDALLSSEGTNSFELAFIDADKPSYLDYYERCVELVRPGGAILIDNVLWSGRVVDATDNDANTVAIRALNDRVHADERVDSVILPIADGLTLARVR